MNGDIETVTQVLDGECFKTSDRKRTVRLAAVHAPKGDTPRGRKATKALTSLIGGRQVKVKMIAIDIYGRAVAIVTSEDGSSVNACMSRLLQGAD